MYPPIIGFNQILYSFTNPRKLSVIRQDNFFSVSKESIVLQCIPQHPREPPPLYHVES